MPQGCDELTQDPLPSVRGLFQLSPEHRLAALFSRPSRSSERRGCLPADSVIWLVSALALFAADSIPQVWRRLHPTGDHPEPTDSTFSQARRRLGVAPRRPLFLETARPLATPQSVGTSSQGWRLRGLDGTTLDLADTPDNARPFGRPTAGRAEGAFPQVRLLALWELGTHAVGGLVIKPLGHGEPSMVGQLLDHLGPGLLLSWDRGCFSSELLAAVVRRGAPRRARLKSNPGLRPSRRLAEGSCLAQISPSEADRRRARRGLPVRVVESTPHDPHRPGGGERPRLSTDLTHPDDLPAPQAPLISHERGEEELAFDQIKTPLSNRAIPRRRQTPRGVIPEISGLMVAPDVVRGVRPDAAVVANPDPDRLSFIASLRVLPCPLPESPHVATETGYQGLRREGRGPTLRPRRDRWYARVIKRKMSNWMKKRPEHRNPPQPTKPFHEAVVLVI